MTCIVNRLANYLSIIANDGDYIRKSKKNKRYQPIKIQYSIGYRGSDQEENIVVLHEMTLKITKISTLVCELLKILFIFPVVI